MFVLCVVVVMICSPLCHAAIPAHEIETTRALNNNSSNICFTDADWNGHGRCTNATVCA
jgi:hypothetical protein